MLIYDASFAMYSRKHEASSLKSIENLPGKGLNTNCKAEKKPRRQLKHTMYEQWILPSNNLL